MPIIAMKFCHNYSQRWNSYQIVTISSNLTELVHTHQKLYSLTWRNIAVNFWGKIFGHLIALTLILVIMLSGVHWKTTSGSIIDFRSKLFKIWKNGSSKNEEWDALPQDVISRAINAFRKRVSMVIKKMVGI